MILGKALQKFNFTSLTTSQQIGLLQIYALPRPKTSGQCSDKEIRKSARHFCSIPKIDSLTSLRVFALNLYSCTDEAGKKDFRRFADFLVHQNINQIEQDHYEQG